VPLRFLGVLILAFAATMSAARAAPPLEAYGRLPAVEQAELSPDGQHYALVARDGVQRRLYVRKIDGTPEYISGLGDIRLRDLTWAGPDHLLVFGGGTVYRPVAGIPRQEFTGVIHIDVPSRKSYVVFGKSNTLLDAVFGWYGAAKIDGKWYAYVGGVPFEKTRPTFQARGNVYPDLYKVDLDTGRPSLIDASDARRQWVIAADGSVVAQAKYDSTGRNVSIFRGLSDNQPLVTTQSLGSQTSLLGLGRTPGSILYSARTNDGLTVRELRPGGSAEGEVLLSDVDAEHPLRDRETGLLIGSAGRDNAPKLFDPARQKRVDDARKAFPGVRVGLVSYDRDFTHLIMVTDGPKDAGTYWLVDLIQRDASPIGQARPELKPEDVGPVRMVKYKAGDGLEMEGVLTLPLGREAKGLPLVVLPHGGPIVPGDDVSFDWWAQAFASRGYAVFQPNYRGTLGYGEAFRKAAFGEYGRKMQTDLSDGVAALAKEGLVDPKRVCIVGASYGGYAALAGVTLQQGIYRCAVAVAGPSDMDKMVSWIRERAGGDMRSVSFWKSLGGAVGNQNLAAVSPARIADKASAPILLIHGESDTVVPIEQSRMMEKALRQAGKPVELLVMPSEDHWLSLEATRQLMLSRAVAFVEEHDPPT